MRGLKRILAIMVCLAMVVTMLPQNMVAYAADTEYEIYPIPQEMTYEDGEFTITSDVNVVYESDIDDATKAHLEEVLAIKDIDATVTDAVAENTTNILVGVYGSDEVVDTYAEKYSVDASIFEEIDGHVVISSDNEIVVLGKDTDAAFYGITSLKHIFSQLDDMDIRNFVIEDYADTAIRGFIEGYYGIPWSNEDRMSLMDFGGEFKMTGYVFAPKDDPYHTSKWRDLYPADEIAAIKEMVAVGNANKCRFVWTAHPFMGGFNSNNVQGEIDALLAKFEQLYSAGVRQFGVLGDDVGSLNKTIVIQVMNAVSEWANAKGDVYDSVFCPAGYNHSWQGDYSELNTYDAGFPDDVQIFWTGEAVCQPVEVKTLDHFRNHNATNGQRRAPLFWLNWPVNDINGSRLMMGKGSLLHTDIDPANLVGVVTNPMQEAEASKVALFAVADYAWNVKAFDDDQSWADSFKYIDAEAANELHTLAKHMSNPQPNGHGLVLAESEELQPLIREFTEALTSGDSIAEVGEELIEEMEIIAAACDAFHAKSKNEALKDELVPFTGSLKDLVTAITGLTNAAMALEAGEDEAAFEYFAQASVDLSASREHLRAVRNGSQTVSPGSTHLIPLAETIQEEISDAINEIVFGSEAPLRITASSNINSWYSGAIENIVDGNTGTFAWKADYGRYGDYFQVNLSEPSTIYGIKIKNGANNGDAFGAADLEYSTDGENWTKIKSYTNKTIDINETVEIEDVVAVRYICTNGGNTWAAMSEFTVLTAPEEPEDTTQDFTMEVIRTQDGWSIYGGNEANLIDGDDASSVWYNVRQQASENTNTIIPGDYIGVKLSAPIVLGEIRVLQADSDRFSGGSELQYSEDGETWEVLTSFSSTPVEVLYDASDDNVTAQYVRLVSTSRVDTWAKFHEFSVAAKIDHNGNAWSNVAEYEEVLADMGKDHFNLVPTEEITLGAGEYIGLKLDRIHELAKVTADVSTDALTLQVSMNSFEWVDVESGEVTADARYIRLINETDADVTFDIAELSVDTLEAEAKSLKSTNCAIYEDEGPFTNLFDGDWTTGFQFYRNNGQNAGGNIVFDLGSEITIESFKVVCRDGEHDFPRHAKISASVDGETWVEVMTLGDQDAANPGEADNTDEIGYVLPEHEISYNTKMVSGKDIPARFVKFEITRTKVGSNKWVRMQEFEINGGAYIPEVNDPTFEGPGEEQENRYTAITDRDVLTMYTATEKDGELVYHLSDEEAVNVVKIIQNGKSNADVFVRTLDAPDEWVNVGYLASTINLFVQDNILDVKVVWEGVNPSIIEILAYAEEGAVQPEQPEKPEIPVVNKAELQEYVDGLEDLNGDLYTEDSWSAVLAEIVEAKAVLANEEATQEAVDAALAELKAAVEALKNKPAEPEQPVVNKTGLEAAIEAVEGLNEEAYTADSWAKLEAALTAAEAIVADKDATQEKVNAALAALETAVEGLETEKPVVNKAALENLMNEVADADYKKADYTEASWDIFTSALLEAQAIYHDAEATQEDVDAAVAGLKAAVEALTLVKDEVVDTDKEDADKEDADKEDAADKDESPETGDATTIMMWMMLMAAAAAVIVVRRKRVR